jgi:pilus assembly protein CpaF
VRSNRFDTSTHPLPPERIGELRDAVLREWRGDSDDALRRTIHRLISHDDPLRDPSIVAREIDAVAAEVIGLGPLEILIADPMVNEVMVNQGSEVWVERGGVLERVDVFIDNATTMRCIERIIGPLGLRIDRLVPFVDARLADGSRLNAVIAPLAVDGPCLTIRRFRQQRFTLDDFIDDASIRETLEQFVRQRRSILVSGPTGSGKTSLLSALSRSVSVSERIVSIEDTAELQLQAAHVVRLEARSANVEGAGGITVRMLVRNALRMRPDRLIIGEVRGAEAFDMVQAMHTGHRGSMSTLHANSADDALRRLEVMMLMADAAIPLDAVRRQIASAIDVVVQVDRDGDGRRRITEIAHVAQGDVPRATPIAGLCATGTDRVSS